MFWGRRRVWKQWPGNLLCRSGWSQIHGDSLAFAFLVLGLQVCIAAAGAQMSLLYGSKRHLSWPYWQTSYCDTVPQWSEEDFRICFEALDLGWEDGLAGKGSCRRGWQLEFRPSDLHGRRRKLAHTSCLLTSTHMLWHVGILLPAKMIMSKTKKRRYSSDGGELHGKTYAENPRLRP